MEKKNHNQKHKATTNLSGIGVVVALALGGSLVTAEQVFAEGSGSAAPIAQTNGSSATSTTDVSPQATDDEKEGTRKDDGGLNPVTLSLVGNDNGGLVEPNTVKIIGGKKGIKIIDGGKKAVVPGEGTWTIDDKGNATFTPEEGFEGNPTPIKYEVADKKGNIVKAAAKVVYPEVTSQQKEKAEANAKEKVAIDVDKVGMTAVEILKTSAIVTMPTVNLEQGYASMTTMNQRRGDNLPMMWDSCGCLGKNVSDQVWARLYGKAISLDGKNRFDTKLNLYGLQVGYDFMINYDPEDGGRTHTGVFAGYNKASSTKFDDKYLKNTRIGSGDSETISIGIEHTRYAKNGAYLDLVGQVNYFNNTYKPENNNKYISNDKYGQDGYGVGLSVEVGKPYEIGRSKYKEPKWIIEPQAQLMYQYINLDGANQNATASIESSEHHGLRARIGAKLSRYSYNNTYANDFYAYGNIYRDLSGQSDLTVGGVKYGEDYKDTWAEIGVGFDNPVSKNLRVFGSAGYEHSLTGSNRKGWNANIGLKYSWDDGEYCKDCDNSSNIKDENFEYFKEYPLLNDGTSEKQPVLNDNNDFEYFKDYTDYGSKK